MGARELVLSLLLVACSGGAKSAYDSQPRGCRVMVFDSAPTPRTVNVGTVVAYCDEDDPRDVCVRELEDQVCLLGGDVLWQIEGPSLQATANGMRQRMRGRAAHLSGEGPQKPQDR